MNRSTLDCWESIVLILSILACLAVRCPAADQPTVLVVAQDGSRIWYHQNGEPIDSEDIPKGTELRIESTAGERCFVTFKGKPAYIRRQLLATKQEYQEHFVAEQKAKGLVEYKGGWMTPEEKSVGEQTDKGLVEYKGKWITPETKTNLENGLVLFNGEWITEQEKFRREQTAKGLVGYQGEWVTPETKANLERGLVQYKGEWITKEEYAFQNLQTQIESTKEKLQSSTLEWHRVDGEMMHLNAIGKSRGHPELLQNYRRLGKEVSELESILESLRNEYNRAASQRYKTQTPAQKHADSVQLKQRLERNKKQMDEIWARAHTGYSERRDNAISSSNLAKDYSGLMENWNRLKEERDALEQELLSLTGENAHMPDASEKARAAADAYIALLKERGIVFNSQFGSMISYDLSPPKMEVIYKLDYVSQSGMRLVGPYTITVEYGSADGWQVVGTSEGDRRANFFEPVRGADGMYRGRSPMEQMIGGAMNR